MQTGVLILSLELSKILLDSRYADIDLFAVDQCRNLLKAVSLCKFSVFFYQKLFKNDSGFFEKRRRNLAVRTGLGGKQDDRAGLCFRRFGRNFFFHACRLLRKCIRSDTQMTVRNVVDLSVLEFLRFTGIPVLNRTVVTGDTAVDLGLAAAFRAGVNLSGYVAVVGAYRIGRRKGVIGKLVIFGNLADKVGGCFPIRQLFA